MKSKRSARLNRQRQRLIDNLKLNRTHVFWWLVVVIYAAVLGYIAFGPLFRLKQVTCQIAWHQPCPESVSAEISKYAHRHLLGLPLSTLRSRLLSNLPEIESVQLTPVWPDQLELVLIPQPIMAYLKVPQQDVAYTVSQSGVIMGITDNPATNHPIITASSAADLIISDTITEPSLTASLALINQFHHARYRLTQVDVRSFLDIRAQLNDSIQVGFSANRPINQQVAILHQILDNTTIDYAGQIIDLRSDRPAIRQSW